MIDLVPCWIEFYMRRDHKSVSDMAKLLKVTERTWRNWMNDPSGMTLGTLSIIATIFECRISELMKEV